MAETKDAFTLSSGTPQETAYAEYANKMKALANQARKEAKVTGSIQYSSEAKQKYDKEVKDLDAKLRIVQLNAPKERQAQLMANAKVQAMKNDNPDMTKKELKKIGQQALTKARSQVGAKRTHIDLTDSEWEAIQAGAISESKLVSIINNVKPERLRELSTPRTSKTELSTAKKNKIKFMENSGYTTAEIAEALGVSTTAISNVLRGKS